MGKKGHKGNRGTAMSLGEFNSTPTDAEAHAEQNALLARQREEQKRASETAAKQAAFYQAATALGEAQFEQSNALMHEETSAREALREKMATENPETVRMAQRFVQAMLQRSMNELAAKQDAPTTAQRIADRNAAAIQKMRQRNGLFKAGKPVVPGLEVTGHKLRAPGR